jgi:hypothetical protein
MNERAKKLIEQEPEGYKIIVVGLFLSIRSSGILDKTKTHELYILLTSLTDKTLIFEAKFE